MNKIFLQLGSNLGDRCENLLKATRLISEEIGSVISISNIYESTPWGVDNQRNFLNQVLCVQTKIDPFIILENALQIEKEMGRIRIEKWGERIIDIDILFIDEIHTVIGAGATSGGSMDASNLLKPSLSNGSLRCIGSTTYKEFNNTLKKETLLKIKYRRSADKGYEDLRNMILDIEDVDQLETLKNEIMMISKLNIETQKDELIKSVEQIEQSLKSINGTYDITNPLSKLKKE